MKRDQITLMEAYLIDTLRHAGVTNNDIVTTIERGDYSVWETVSEVFDYVQLKPLYEADVTRFKRILEKGYQIKFLTFPGLQRLLHIIFNKIPEHDFVVEEKGISQLTLTDEEYVHVEQLLSKNWKLVREGAKYTIQLIS